MSKIQTPDLSLIRPHIRTELDSSRVSRDMISTILDSTTFVLEETLIGRHKRKYGKGLLKNTLKGLVNEGILDTGCESGVRWYFFRRECQNHFTAKIVPNEEYRNQLRTFLGIYEE